MHLGCIGDDFTGSSDLANTLAKGGMATVQYSGVPSAPAAEGVEAGVVALKSRTIPVADAVAQSLAALDWLRAQGCSQIFFKICSTFDSTPEGNIGPVADALLDALDIETPAIVCPAFPATGRTVFHGHLFVGDRLLSASGMENHPLTPMTDPDIRRWLSHQTRHPVGHLPAATVWEGAEAVAAALAAEGAAGRRLVVADAIRDEDLVILGRAAGTTGLLVGGSGLGLGLPANFRAGAPATAPAWQGIEGPVALLSGSCSRATNGQVAHHAARHPALAVEADEVVAGRITAEEVTSFMLAHPNDLPLAYSSADPARVAAAQEAHGRETVAEAIEGLFADTARRLAAAGVTRIVTAGGETSGAVVEALDLTALEIGPEIDPGVPALRATGRPLTLALKSGNFGAVDFFEKAAAVLAGR
ncbi:MAG: 3-oxo-tetronate kinase [Pseudomonadota bacterium]